MKLKERSGMKQYIKSKSIKWGFKFWFRCSSKTGYFYQKDIYLGKKQNTEFNLGEEVVLQFPKDLHGSFCTVYYDIFFSSLFDKNIHAIGTVRKNRKQMPKMLEDKKMKWGDCEFLYSKNVMACKWMNNRSVQLVSTALEGIDDVTSVQRREKGSATKSAIPFPTVVKLYSNDMGGVDLMDQRTAAYWLDRKSSVRFNLRIFFDLLVIACVNSFLVSDMKHPKQLIRDYEIVIIKNLIQWHQIRERAVPLSRPSKRKSTSVASNDHGGHLPEFQPTRKRCTYCSKEGEENRTFVVCLACNIPLCLVKDINCFSKHHM